MIPKTASIVGTTFAVLLPNEVEDDDQGVMVDVTEVPAFIADKNDVTCVCTLSSIATPMVWGNNTDNMDQCDFDNKFCMALVNC